MRVKPCKVFDDRECRLGEGPHYDDRTATVWWVDILASRVLWRSFDGSNSGEIATPGHVGAVIPRTGGGLLACLPWGVAAIDRPETGTWQELVRYPEHRDGWRSNDAKADPLGRLWLGTMAYEETAGKGALHRLDPDSMALKVMVADTSVSNGMGWSPDGKTMYYIDSPTKSIDAFHFDMAAGEPSQRRRFAAVEDGFPDGMTVDAEGAVWVAIWQGARVERFKPDGRHDLTLELPVPNVTSCAFAGPELDTLIVTTVGPTFSFEVPGRSGLPVDRFAG